MEVGPPPRCLTCDDPIPKKCHPVRFETSEPVTTWAEAQAMIDHGTVMKVSRDGGYNYITRAYVWTGEYKDGDFCSYRCMKKFATDMARTIRRDLAATALGEDAHSAPV